LLTLKASSAVLDAKFTETNPNSKAMKRNVAKKSGVPKCREAFVKSKFNALSANLVKLERAQEVQRCDGQAPNHRTAPNNSD